ncbi:L-fucose isomerase [Corynebacterium sp. CCM 8835]|uniref:L-fucose isomerase n=1 Tax=Corynebacterium antarcticum TaxID=2800405 RepID=A0A9Q4CEM2_9CORY|nr:MULTISPECIES: L-fucose isomerase [Corynebacterium]MBV7292599.1 L-fucose isomerase [Corynebacterium sp. TAE3-ERU16]MCK7642246.1 L-fucose isomerase [Corynebacterium antarcticum]MCK7661069.1 L-fucose isomerase [Corynebacterium antarcticum]MCL0245817.1 L-fucose isomerase [Corynebacterium antarcticum]MCX7491726.1 L-fucose isomerase [Corynebacterium antarcticum]
MTNHPAIGIRPLIDGRLGGVRESLEDQTMELAHNVAKLLRENVRYTDGEPVEVVIADTTIGGAAEAAACKKKFDAHNVGADLTVTSSWNYVTEVMDLDPSIPHAIWGFNGTERPGAVTLAAALAAYTQLGIPAFGIYGHDVQDASDDGLTDDVVAQILKFARAAIAVGQMKGRSYLAMGTVSMGIAGCRVPEVDILKYLGLKSEYIDMIEFDRRINQGIYDKDEYEIARKWVRENFVEGENPNPEDKRLSDAEYEEQWDYITKMTLVANDLMNGNPKLAEMGFAEEAHGHDAIAAGFQGQRQWTDYKPNGDLLETILNTSFDWNGKRQPSILATEGDVLNGLAMLLNNLLTNRAQLFSDVRTYWSPEAVKRVTGYELSGHAANGFVDLRNSGATTLDGACGAKDADGNPTIKPWWEMTDEDIEADIKASTFHAAIKEYFPGGGFSTHFNTPGDLPVTASRLVMVDGLGLALQVSEGWTVMVPDEVRDAIADRTNPTWPTTFFAPRLTGEGAHRSVYDWMDNWGANHTATGYGHFGDELLTLASMLRIPVFMHNIEPERIFRPRAWSSFGTTDLESADFRACANFGPLYR